MGGDRRRAEHPRVGDGPRPRLADPRPAGRGERQPAVRVPGRRRPQAAADLPGRRAPADHRAGARAHAHRPGLGHPVRPRPADRRSPSRSGSRDGERRAGPGARWSPTSCAAGRPRCCSRAAPAPGSAACSRSSTSSTAPTRPPSGPSSKASSSRTRRWPTRCASRMFVFEDIVTLEDRACSWCCARSTTPSSPWRSRVSPTTVRDKVIGNMSERAPREPRRGDPAARAATALDGRRGPGRHRPGHPHARGVRPDRPAAGGDDELVD